MEELTKKLQEGTLGGKVREKVGLILTNEAVGKNKETLESLSRN